ncbi:hypothetical protein BMS3Abin17_01015 [archaeon BMS3Abin17]|nr:hypothetical protein BMS3Abin17_01015 [archaeon BMS3Abin17]HDZ61243.1 hypothetical protein [Candidatus Pacearchaeota archaeon]
MPKRTEMWDIKVERPEKGKEKTLKVVFSSPCGKYSIETEGKNILLFEHGKRYNGIFTISDLPDFPGDKDEWKNVCTISYNLERIVDKGRIIFENK